MRIAADRAGRGSTLRVMSNSTPQHRRPRPTPEPRRNAGVVALGVAALVVVAVVAVIIGTGSSPPKRPTTTTTTTIAVAGVSATVPPTTTAPSALNTTTPKTATTLPPVTSTSTTSAATVASTTGVAPSDVLVEVLNGSGAPGQATTVGTALHNVGFALNGTGNAKTFQYTTSEIEYAPGHRAAAEVLLGHLNGPAYLQSDTALTGDDVVLIVGSTFRSVAT